MSNGTAADERLGHLVHLDGAHHAGEDVLLLQRVLQRERVDDRGQHTHVIGGDAVHLLGLFGDAAKEVAAADYDGDLDPGPVDLTDFSRDFVHPLVVDSKALPGGQCLAGELQQNAFVDGSVHVRANLGKYFHQCSSKPPTNVDGRSGVRRVFCHRSE